MKMKNKATTNLFFAKILIKWTVGINMKYLSASELKRCLNKAIDSNFKHLAVLETLAGSGVRVSELINITVNNIDFENHKITVLGKGNKIRDIYISQSLVNTLKLYVQTKNLRSFDKLFPYRRQSVYNICKRYSSKGPHAFRHTYAIHVLRATNNVEFLRQQLGHENLKTTGIYLRHSNFEQEKKKLEDIYDD